MNAQDPVGFGHELVEMHEAQWIRGDSLILYEILRNSTTFVHIVNETRHHKIP